MFSSGSESASLALFSINNLTVSIRLDFVHVEISDLKCCWGMQMFPHLSTRCFGSKTKIKTKALMLAGRTFAMETWFYV